MEEEERPEIEAKRETEEERTSKRQVKDQNRENRFKVIGIWRVLEHDLKERKKKR